MSSALSAPHFHSEEADYAYVEARIWPNGATCPHCGGVALLKGATSKRLTYETIGAR